MKSIVLSSTNYYHFAIVFVNEDIAGEDCQLLLLWPLAKLVPVWRHLIQTRSRRHNLTKERWPVEKKIQFMSQKFDWQNSTIKLSLFPYGVSFLFLMALRASIGQIEHKVDSLAMGQVIEEWEGSFLYPHSSWQLQIKANRQMKTIGSHHHEVAILVPDD